MNLLNQEALAALAELENLEKACCLKMVDRLKHLGLHHHSSDAVCALAAAEAMPIKR